MATADVPATGLPDAVDGWLDEDETGVIAVTGRDARAFLHRQVSTDVLQLGADRCQLTSWSDGRGRLQAIMHIAAVDDGFLLALPRAQVDPVVRGMVRYVLRDDVGLRDVSDEHGRIGVTGERATRIMEAALGTAPPGPEGHTRTPAGVSVLRLAGTPPRWLICEPPDALGAMRSALADALPALTPAQWRALRIAAGIPVVHEQTTGQFTAQMVNLDRLGAIDFDKGCYPGQEVIARTHYLGRIKRRMFVMTGHSVQPPEPGVEIRDETDSGAAAGIVVEAVSVDSDTILLTAVLRLAAADHELVLGTPDSPRVRTVPSAVTDAVRES